MNIYNEFLLTPNIFLFQMFIDEYDVLSILGNNINSSTYKVKHKKTGKVLVWRTLDYENKNDANKHLIDIIKKRIDTSHPNIIKFHNYIKQEESKILYLVIEYCEHGSLKNMIDSCLANNICFSEELVCKILYQIAFTVKTIRSYSGRLSVNEVFLDEDFNIKLFNFEPNNNVDTLKETKTYDLGLILHEICTFEIFNESTYENRLKLMENKYSHSLLSLIMCLIKDKTELRKNVNKILCHPTVLLKSTQWLKEKCFINIEKSEKCISVLKNTKSQDEANLYTSKLEKLRNKEAFLQIREQQLNEREYKLILKEKKIALMERAVKEKLQQAELYLKRCRESKSASGDSAKSTSSTQKQKKLSYENLDSTYVSCGDSIILPTSSKLNINKIIKPASFTRTLSERRIRFKGHSPLKEIDYNKKNIKQSKSQKGNLRKKSEWLTCSEDTDKSSLDGNSKETYTKAKQLFSKRNAYENENENFTNYDMECTPITWTEENKRYAFELLRTMNIDKENQAVEVKHTCL